MQPHTRGLVIGRVAGAPVVLTPSSALMAVIIALLFAPTFGDQLGVSTGAGYGVAAAFAVVLLLSILVHELAHGLVARANGLRVREFALTLLGGHTQMTTAPGRPGVSALIAAAGPVANLVLAAVLGLGAALVHGGGAAYAVLFTAASANAFVGVLNLAPGLPLDGGKVLESVVWAITRNPRTGTVAAAWAGRVVAVVFVAVVLFWQARSPWGIDLFQVAWSAVVGAFLWSGAGQALRESRTERVVEALTVTGVGTPAVAVAASATLAEADAARSISGADAVVLLSPDGRPAAYVDPAAADAVPGADRVRVPVTAVAVGLPAGAVVDADLTGSALLSALAAVSRFAPVIVGVRDGRVVALLRAADVAARLRS
ncbi:site-2 protease family protein [Cellulomonas sp. NPDC089187]|uniref:site-2 protease family protein n=1 Tax=Cellulomonas sp. NPDC089187 TaxID=3154970 RepID=UPI003446BB1F